MEVCAISRWTPDELVAKLNRVLCRFAHIKRKASTSTMMFVRGMCSVAA